MQAILHKWLIVLFLTNNPPVFKAHPVYVTVTEIEHNKSTESLEITCRFFTDDFEQILKTNFKTRIDLLHPVDSAAMIKLIDRYIQPRFSIRSDKMQCSLACVGYERYEETIQVYYESNKIKQPHNFEVRNSLLYDYKPQQMGLIHVTANGKRQTLRLINPENEARFSIEN